MLLCAEKSKELLEPASRNLKTRECFCEQTVKDINPHLRKGCPRIVVHLCLAAEVQRHRVLTSRDVDQGGMHGEQAGVADKVLGA